MSADLSRRSLFAGFGLLALPAGPGLAAPVTRVAALGWATAQSLLAIGAVPLAMPEIARYQRLVVEPPVPDGVLEAGLRSEPNLELLVQLRPDLIVIDPSLSGARRRLERIAPVEVCLVIATPQHRAYEQAQLSLAALAERIDRATAGEAYLDRVETMIEAAAPRLARYRGGPLYIVGELLGGRMLIFGGRSIYQDMFDRFGLSNAWTGETSVWGHATVPLEVMAEVPDARLLVLSGGAADMLAQLQTRPLLRRLPFVRARRITVLDNMLFYGGVPTAERFTRLLAERLPLDGLSDGDGHG